MKILKTLALVALALSFQISCSDGNTNAMESRNMGENTKTSKTENPQPLQRADADFEVRIDPTENINDETSLGATSTCTCYGRRIRDCRQIIKCEKQGAWYFATSGRRGYAWWN